MISIIIERRRKTHVTYNKFSIQAAPYYFEGRLTARRLSTEIPILFSRAVSKSLRRNTEKETESKSNDAFACGLIFVENI